MKIVAKWWSLQPLSSEFKDNLCNPIPLRQNIFSCQPISKLCKENVLHIYKEIENICKILLSDTLDHTLVNLNLYKFFAID